MMTGKDYTESSQRSLQKAQKIESRADFPRNVKTQILSEKLRGWSVSQRAHAEQMKLFGFIKIFHSVRKYKHGT